MSTRERLTLAAALAVALGSSAVAPLYADLGWLNRSMGAIAAIAVIGLLCRRLAVPALLQPVAALAALLEFTALAFAHSTMHLGLIPSGRTITTLRALFESGMDEVRQLAPPVPTHEGLVLLAVLGIGAVAIVVDLLAVVLGRAALAGLPLLVLFALPSAVHPGGVGWLPFTLGAIGWLGLLLVEGGDRMSRWGTPLKAARPRAAYDDTSLGRVGRRIGAAALGVAVVVPALLPGLDGRLLGGGSGADGSGGGGSRTTTTYNPITRLRDQLRLPDPKVILTYKTDDPTPDYLRMTTLDRFSDAGWEASRLSGNTKRNGVDRGIPRPLGLTSVDTYDVHSDIRIRTLAAQWLPTPFPARSADVDGPWLYDRRSETIYGIRTGTRDLRKSYSVTASRLVPNRGVLDALSAGGLPTELTSYVSAPDVPKYVQDRTADAIGNATTPYAKVAGIQQWFLDPANKFEYALTADVGAITSPSDLENFLRRRKGFCEQYASAMAAMIRVAGVPARVAIGFTRGTLNAATDTWTVTTDDAHAWPEAWFAGAGWVRFEPTPRGQVDNQAVVPPYALATTPNGPAGPTLPLGGAATPGRGLDPIERLDLRDPDPAPPTPVAVEEQDSSSLPPLWLVALAVVVVLSLLPSVLHTLRQRRRWSAPGPLVAWAQLQDDAVDVGHTWRPQDSPRAAAAQLGAERSLSGSAREALDRLARAAERARYARVQDDADGADLRADADTVRAALLAGAGSRVRWQARLAPTSTLRWASSASGTFVADQLDRFDDAWAAVKRRLTPGTRPV